MELKINVIDAFTDRLFKGNPAAVIITESWLEENLMQSIATENNLSETAFVVPSDNNKFVIRWFSPLKEVAFCGHATLASAFVIFQRSPGLKSIKFVTKTVGVLTVGKNKDGLLQMDFPNTKPEKVKVIPLELKAGLSIEPVEVYRNAQAYFAIYSLPSEVLSVSADNEILKQLSPFDVVVTSCAEFDGYDFVSRYFWPANGGDEDPVTGSIHTGLAPFWADRLNKNELVAYQASKRGGVLHCKVSGTRVLVTGHAIQYLEGKITIPSELE